MPRTARKINTSAHRKASPRATATPRRSSKATAPSREYANYLASKAEWDALQSRPEPAGYFDEKRPETAECRAHRAQTHAALRRYDAATKAFVSRPLRVERDIREFGAVWIATCWEKDKNGEPYKRRCRFDEVEVALARALARSLAALA